MSQTEFKINEAELQVTISRVFNASRERVWRANTDPVEIAQWWGPREMKMSVEKFDAREGGKWRILHTDRDGNEFWFSGEYKEVVEPERIVRTFIYEGFPDSIMNETATFEEVKGSKTRLTTVSQFPSIEALRGMVTTGMERGSRESIDRLAELVEKK